MNVSLTPRLEQFVREQVESGMYNTASDVVWEALRLLDDRDRERRLRDELAFGFAQIERGEGIELTDELVDEIKCRASDDHRREAPFKHAVTP